MYYELMFKKRMFLFSLALNVFFYLGTATALYWHQSLSIKNDVFNFYKKQTGLLEQELFQRKAFYKEWLAHNKELPKNSKDLDLFMKMNRIRYLGYFENDKLFPLSANKEKPTFPHAFLQIGSGTLFHRDKQKLYFTYTYTPPNSQRRYVITHPEPTTYFINRLQQVGAYLMVLEKVGQDPITTLYSNMKPAITEKLAKTYPLIDTGRPEPEVTLAQEDFYILPIVLFKSKDVQQALLVVFNRSEFYFTQSVTVAISLLALFCASSTLLFYGYLRSKE